MIINYKPLNCKGLDHLPFRKQQLRRYDFETPRLRTNLDPTQDQILSHRIILSDSHHFQIPPRREALVCAHARATARCVTAAEEKKMSSTAGARTDDSCFGNNRISYCQG